MTGSVCMKLTRNGRGDYTIENIYSLDNYVKTQIINYLKLNNDDLVLFQFIEDYGVGEKDIISLDDNNDKFIVEGFVSGYLCFKKESTSIRIEEAIKHLFMKYGYSNTDALYSDFLLNPFSIEPKLISEISRIIYANMLSESKDSIPNFIADNIVFRNTFSLQVDDYQHYKLIDNKKSSVLWYKILTLYESIVALDYDPLFKGIIINSKRTFNEYYCTFWCYETASNYNIGIYYKNNNDLLDEKITQINALLNSA